MHLTLATNSFVSDLRIKASTCEFDVLHDELVSDRIVTGITNTLGRKQLLKESELTLAKAIQICQINELGQNQQLDNHDTEVNYLNFNKPYRKYGYRTGSYKSGNRNNKDNKLDKPETRAATSGRHTPAQQVLVNCNRCGNRHANKSCPAPRKSA